MMTMKKMAVTALMVLGLSGATVSLAGATDSSASPNLLADIKKALGMSVYIQAGYTYNFGNPDNGENDLRYFDHDADNLTLDLAELVFSKDPVAGSAGYRLKLSAGETAKLIHSSGLGNADDSLDLTEAYLSYIAPVGKGLRFDAGKFVTMHGSEVIEAKDNANYSRSFLFNYAIPFTHTGLKVSYPVTDSLSAAFYLVNGWDNSTDNNGAKTVGVSFGLTPSESFSGYLNLMYGPEQTDNARDYRFLTDVVLIVKPVKNLTLNLNLDYATEENAAPDGSEAKWYGAALIAKYDLNDTYSVALRGEYFNDEDGVRTGTEQELTELTLTGEARLAEGLILRPELRFDWSDERVFDTSASKASKDQTTLALAAMYTW